MASSGRHQLLSAFWHVALAWCLGITCVAGHALHDSARDLGSAVKGRVLLRRQPPGQVWPLVPAPAAAPPPPGAAPPPPAAGQADALQGAIRMKLQELDQEAANIIQMQSAAITVEASTKQKEGIAVVESELPLAALNDTSQLTMAMNEQQKELEADQARSTNAAKEAILDLKAKTDTAINVSVAYEVRTVEKDALEAVKSISDKAATMQAEAAALSKESTGSLEFTKTAHANSKMWVDQLPAQEAAVTNQMAQKAKAESRELLHETWGTMRNAKLAGNLALDTMRLTALAKKYEDDAQMTASKTAHQAATNAAELNTIHDMIAESEQIANTKLAR